jgi:hypothetical protein
MLPILGSEAARIVGVLALSRLQAILLQRVAVAIDLTVSFGFLKQKEIDPFNLKLAICCNNGWIRCLLKL